MPTRHRDALVATCEGRLTLTRHPDGCVLVYPRPSWEQRRAEIAALPYAARAFQRLLLGNAIDVDLDSAGRFLVPGELRGACGLSRQAMLLGMGGHFELWDVERHAEQEKALAAGILEAVSSFTF